MAITVRGTDPMVSGPLRDGYPHTHRAWSNVGARLKVRRNGGSGPKPLAPFLDCSGFFPAGVSGCLALQFRDRTTPSRVGGGLADLLGYSTPAISAFFGFPQIVVPAQRVEPEIFPGQPHEASMALANALFEIPFGEHAGTFTEQQPHIDLGGGHSHSDPRRPR